MSKFFKYGGLVASIVLIAFGAGAVYMGIDGRDRVQSDLAREQIVGTPDSTIPGQKVDTGSEAQAFAATIRKHTLEATEGKTYAQMPRFLDENGNGTNDEAAAAKDPKTGEPVANQARNIWVTSTALSTAHSPTRDGGSAFGGSLAAGAATRTAKARRAGCMVGSDGVSPIIDDRPAGVNNRLGPPTDGSC